MSNITIGGKNKRKQKGPRQSAEGTTTMSQGLQVIPPPSDVPATRRRGRQPGSKNRQSISLGRNFTPKIIIVNRGENVMEKIYTVSRSFFRTIVISANGSLSTVTVRHPESPNVMLYEGCFTITSLCGSSIVESNSVSSRVSVSVSGIDGRLYGGEVSGPLVAASRVQVVLATTECPRKRRKTSVERAEKETPAAQTPVLLEAGPGAKPK